MTTPLLNHDLVQAPDATPSRWMLVLHGIYGAGRNWGSVARRFVEARPDWGAILVDLREHGGSTGFPAPHTVDACADDLLALVSSLDRNVAAILGHSFGGKVSLRYAERAAADPHAPHLEQVWIIDSTPDARAPSGSAWRMLQLLRDEPGPFADRAEAVAAVESAGFTRGVAQWMSSNLERTDDDRLAWRLDIDVMEALVLDFFDLDAWSAVEHPPAGTVIHFVKGSESSVLDEEATARIEAVGLATAATHLHVVEGGHWLNADNPEALHALLTEWMAD